ncbi:MAG: exodeoxyribonuclease III [Acidobacteria bacterium]|jgi:exodeoxyribonuclease-3|nr:exodeoxyribonuclease III [Acidobacteriota bacterium]
MKVITWNVNGIRARQAQVQELLEAEQPDVLCIQEVKATPAQVPELLVNPGEYWSYWHGGGGYSGVALLVRRTFAPEPPQYWHPDFDFEHRIVVADVQRGEGPNPGAVRFVSVYVPNGGKDYEAKMRFFTALDGWLDETIATVPALVLCGDINIAREERDVHPKERKPNQIGTRPEERALFAQVLGRGLVDIGRTVDPENDDLFTWWAPWRSLRQRNIGWRIDYVLATPSLAPQATGCVSRREFGTSDHAPVVATFAS